MASARPVVSTQVAGIPELVVDGQTGILVSPGDLSALTQALEQLLRDGELWLRYGQAGHARIEQHFEFNRPFAPLLAVTMRFASIDQPLLNLLRRCAQQSDQ